MKNLGELINTRSDINEHLLLLSTLAEGLKVVEIGFRTGVSATAFLHGCSSLVSVDLEKCDTTGFAERPQFQFVQGDSTVVAPIACDFLFIDGNHDYSYVASDLLRWGPLASRYIGLHDTANFKLAGARRAVLEWLSRHENHRWFVLHDRENNNGLMILEKR